MCLRLHPSSAREFSPVKWLPICRASVPVLVEAVHAKAWGIREAKLEQFDRARTCDVNDALLMVPFPMGYALGRAFNAVPRTQAKAQLMPLTAGLCDECNSFALALKLYLPNRCRQMPSIQNGIGWNSMMKEECVMGRTEHSRKGTRCGEYKTTITL